MLIGFGLILLGYVLMIGGGTTDKMVYPEETLYGFQRTVLAPLTVIGGFITVGVAIFLKPNMPLKTEEELAEGMEREEREYAS